MRPFARHDLFVVRDLPGETLVYEKTHHTAHCLNRTAALIWRHCDGTRTVRELAALVERETGNCGGEQVVQLALNYLGKSGLLESGFTLPSEANVQSRRGALLKMGLAAIAIPLVQSVTAPLAQAAGSVVYIVEPAAPAGPTGPTGTTGTTGPTGPTGPRHPHHFHGFPR
jgi:hypothetical protein